jgi:short-subunit dehydrogenase
MSLFNSEDRYSPTPWNGVYCSSKAALHSLTEVLQMECRPFDINVMLVSPGSVKSNIATNQAATFELPPNSLYIRYLHNIMDRLYASQGLSPMDTDEFAQMVVSKALRKNPPFYVTGGGKTTIFIFTILKWLPNAWVRNYMWKRFSRPESA